LSSFGYILTFRKNTLPPISVLKAQEVCSSEKLVIYATTKMHGVINQNSDIYRNEVIDLIFLHCSQKLHSMEAHFILITYDFDD
jgi:hypothetical protein